MAPRQASPPAKRPRRAPRRRPAAAPLPDLESCFHALFHNAPLQSVLYRVIRDAPGLVVDWEVVDINALGAAAIGLTRAAAIGKRALALFGAAVMAPYLELSREVMATGEARQVETHFAANGRDYLSAVVAVGTDLYANLSLDVTTRRQAEADLRASERLFRAIYDIAPVGISVLDRERRFLSVNAALGRLLRLAPDGLASGAHRKRRYLRADGTPMPAREFASSRALATGRPVREVVTGVVTETGETVWTQVSAAPLGLPDARVVVVTQDITARYRAELELAQSREALRALLARLERTREEERARLARDIHDDLGQNLTALKMDLRGLERALAKLADGPALTALRARAAGATALVDQTIAAVQRLAAEIRPGVLDQLGLAAALQCEARRFQERYDIACATDLPGDLPTVAADATTALFRICQECLTNVARHAHASRASIALAVVDDDLILRVTDNGRGVRPADLASPGALGLLGMKERAAMLGGAAEVEAVPSGGTSVTVRLPRSAWETPEHGRA